jgi:hypothetical protein
MPYKDPEKRRAAQRRYEKKRVRPLGYEEERKAAQRRYEKKRVRPSNRREWRKIYRNRTYVREKMNASHRRYEKNSVTRKKQQHYRKKLREAVVHQRCYISTIHKLIGCDAPTARAHLEAQFEPWMGWENYGCGEGKWTIDHIAPVASIDIFNTEDVTRIFHYTNMQPLEFVKNSTKGKA